MYKSQLQELAQRSCFNLPSYACIREGPDHAPRFKASVNFNGEIFESPGYCTTLRKAEHAAAEVALNVLSTRGPSRSLTARILDETGVYKNLLQETAHRTGLKLPVYTTVRSGPGHVPVFTSSVELAGMNFTGESGKTKKQAEKNAAIAAWSSLKKMPNLGSLSQSSKETEIGEEQQDEAVVARVLSNFRGKEEKKAIRRRDDEKQTRRGVMNRDDDDDDHHVWRPMDLLMDSFSEGAAKQKQKSFVSLLPPPPPRTSSKILQTASSRDGNNSCLYQYSTPLDEHKKDEEEWVSGKSDHVMEKKALLVKEKEKEKEEEDTCVYNRAFAALVPNYSGRSRLVGAPISSSSSSSTCSSSSSSSSISSRRLEQIGGYYKYNPQRRIAPAVQIRSVIPVCATPSSQALRPPQPSIKQAAASPSTTTSMSTHTREGAEATTFNKLLQVKVNATQLSSSDFNNKIQLRRN